jgi:hypothetical protein
MSGTDAIWWYKKCLLPMLAKKVDTMPATGADWTSLEDLIKYAIAEEARDKRSSSSSPADVQLAAVHTGAKSKRSFHRGPRSQGAGGGKKPLGVRGGGVTKKEGELWDCRGCWVAKFRTKSECMAHQNTCPSWLARQACLAARATQAPGGNA